MISRRRFLGSSAMPAALAFLPSNLHAKAVLPSGSEMILCEGTYADHLQGVCADADSHLFWSFTTALVKTDGIGKVLHKMEVPAHHGAPCYTAGRLYVPVNLTVFNDAAKPADSWIYVYDAADLALVSKHRAPQVIYGAGGIAFHHGHFLVVGGLPEGYAENYLYQYDLQLRFVREVRLNSGYTRKGIQTSVFGDGHWWFGCYGEPEVLLRADEQLTAVSRFSFDCSLGILRVGHYYLVARSSGSCTEGKGCTGTLLPAVQDEANGLRLRRLQ